MQCILCVLLFSLTDCAHEVTPVPVYSRDAMLTYAVRLGTIVGCGIMGDERYYERVGQWVVKYGPPGEADVRLYVGAVLEAAQQQAKKRGEGCDTIRQLFPTWSWP